MSRILRGKAFLFFLIALILLLWYSADHEARQNVIELQKKQSPLAEVETSEAMRSSPLNFAKNLASRLNIPEEQIKGPLDKKESPDDTFLFQQEWRKYPVYEATLTIQAQGPEGFEVLQNSLKNIKDVQANTRFELKEILENFKKAKPDSLIVGQPQQVLFVQADKGELAYLINYEDKEDEKKQTLISAVSSEVLLEKKTF
jgi:hypothetical protein